MDFAIDLEMNVTGKGDAYKIFSTVLSAFNEIVEADFHTMVDEYRIVAEKEGKKSHKLDSRGKLYMRLANKSLPDGYKILLNNKKKRSVIRIVRQGS